MTPREVSCDRLREGDVVSLARSLIGVELHSWVEGNHCAGRIVETEAYRGADDKAAHSYGHRRTARTEVFFGDAGHAYVYLVYGLHHMFNVITGPTSQPDAVLIRAVEPIENATVMLARRNLVAVGPKVSNGPALVCQALGIDRSHYGLDLFAEDSELQLRGTMGGLPDAAITASTRVGVAYAEECAAWPWRFRESGNPYTSPAK